MAITRLYPPPIKIKSQPVCKFWLMGRCKYGPKCRFLHPEDQSPATMIKEVIPSMAATEKEPPKKVTIKKKMPPTVKIKEPLKEPYSGPFSNLTNLQGHKKDITGIVLPIGSDKLYTASRDGTMRIWNCNTGECVAVWNLGGEIGCLISEGTWIFASLPNLIKAWNVVDGKEEPICLKHSLGQVYAMEADGDLLFSGTQEGSVLAWRGSFEANPFKLVASLKGHSKVVLCLTTGAGRLYSGSMDHTVRVWDPKNFECLHVLKEHRGYVTSLICWQSFLLTSSLDKTIKAWALNDGGRMEVIHSRSEEDGIAELKGMGDSEGQPVLLCALKDSSVRVYQLPSFAEKGRISSSKEVKAMKTGPGDLFFTGNGTGTLAVWKWTVEQPSKAAA
ncbi:hypothetical protein SLEP1_g10807 [Rubroshorea leprosula]|uniref:C3H1-type domain-containing protein n=1 Tax=Rubroshorea leprosula TaxID=152421 RepID=A0AAV5IH66_9ROSI|nr:hypothetical protein SLEP1_g10807 [Rubroshorea leprosula]